MNPADIQAESVNHLPDSVMNGNDREEKTLWAWIAQALPYWHLPMKYSLNDFIGLLNHKEVRDCFMDLSRIRFFMGPGFTVNKVYSYLSAKLSSERLNGLIVSLLKSENWHQLRLGWFLITLTAKKEFLQYAESFVEENLGKTDEVNSALLADAMNALWALGSDSLAGLADSKRGLSGLKNMRVLLSYYNSHSELWNDEVLKNCASDQSRWLNFFVIAPDMFIRAGQSGIALEQPLIKMLNKSTQPLGPYKEQVWARLCVACRYSDLFRELESAEKYFELMWSRDSWCLDLLDEEFPVIMSETENQAAAVAIASLRTLKAGEKDFFRSAPDASWYDVIAWAALTDPSLEETAARLAEDSDRITARTVMYLLREKPLYMIEQGILEMKKRGGAMDLYCFCRALSKALRYKKRDIPPFLAEFELPFGDSGPLEIAAFYEQYPHRLWQRISELLQSCDNTSETIPDALMYSYVLGKSDPCGISSLLEARMTENIHISSELAYLMISSVNGPETVLGRAMEKILYFDRRVPFSSEEVVSLFFRDNWPENAPVFLQDCPGARDSCLLSWIFRQTPEVNKNILSKMGSEALINPLLVKMRDLVLARTERLTAGDLLMFGSLVRFPDQFVSFLANIFREKEGSEFALMKLMYECDPEENRFVAMGIALELGLETPWMGDHLQTYVNDGKFMPQVLEIYARRKNLQDIRNILELADANPSLANDALVEVAGANPQLGLIVWSDKTFGIESGIIPAEMIHFLEKLRSWGDGSLAAAWMNRRLLINPVQPSKPVPAVYNPLTHDEFQKIAVYLSISFVDQQTGSAVAVVRNEPSAEVLHYLFQDSRLVLFQASWC